MYSHTDSSLPVISQTAVVSSTNFMVELLGWMMMQRVCTVGDSAHIMLGADVVGNVGKTLCGQSLRKSLIQRQMDCWKQILLPVNKVNENKPGITLLLFQMGQGCVECCGYGIPCQLVIPCNEKF